MKTINSLEVANRIIGIALDELWKSEIVDSAMVEYIEQTEDEWKEDKLAEWYDDCFDSEETLPALDSNECGL